MVILIISSNFVFCFVVIRVAYKVLQLSEVTELEAQIFNLALVLIRIQNIHFSIESYILHAALVDFLFFYYDCV